jgi:hypothetical protein
MKATKELCRARTNNFISTSRSQSRPIVILGSEKFLICFAAALTFFVAGLLYLLRFERVDHSGA